MKYAMIFLLLAACTPQPSDFATDADYQAALEARQERMERIGNASEVIRSVYVSQVEAFRIAGVDIKALSPKQQMMATAACGAMSGLSTVIATDAVELSAEGSAWCAELVKALGENVAE